MIEDNKKEDKKRKDVEGLRVRQVMYTQDLEHLPFKLTELQERLEKSGAIEWAFIVHDSDKKVISSDTSTDGTEDTYNKLSNAANEEDAKSVVIRPHVHAVLKFKNPRTLGAVAKLFDDKPQYLEAWKGNFNNSISYLIHATSGAKGKHQYKASDVVANFDVAKRLKEIETQVKGSKSNVSAQIEAFASGEITRDQLVKEIGVVKVAQKKKLIDSIEEVLEEQAHEEWLNKFKGKEMLCVWLWGKAGVGKTRLAIETFKNRGVTPTILGSSRDPFQPYHCNASGGKAENIILDDFRPNVLEYSDLLRILDPYSHDKMAPARYHDRPLNLEKIIITSPYSPEAFYEATKGIDKSIDKFEQLERRIGRIIHLPEDEND